MDSGCQITLYGTLEVFKSSIFSQIPPEQQEQEQQQQREWLFDLLASPQVKILLHSEIICKTDPILTICVERSLKRSAWNNVLRNQMKESKKRDLVSLKVSL